VKEQQIEEELINKLTDLKYVYRSDINDRASLEENFRKKFEELHYVKLTDSEFKRLLEQIITSDVYIASRHYEKKTASSVMMERRYSTHWSTSRIGVKTLSR